MYHAADLVKMAGRGVRRDDNPQAKIIIRNYPLDTTERDLRIMFEKYGKIDDCEFVKGVWKVCTNWDTIHLLLLYLLSLYVLGRDYEGGLTPAAFTLGRALPHIGGVISVVSWKILKMFPGSVVCSHFLQFVQLKGWLADVASFSSSHCWEHFKCSEHF